MGLAKGLMTHSPHDNITQTSLTVLEIVSGIFALPWRGGGVPKIQHL